MNIVFPDRIDLDEAAQAKFGELGVRIYDDTPSSEAVVIERIRGAKIITANFIDITPAVIDSAPALKFIIAPAVGYEWIDYKYAASKGIKVLNCPTQNTEAVAEHAVALMLAVSHRITEAQISLQTNEWKMQELIGSEISHKKLGLVGYGHVGKRIEKKVSGFDMQVNHVGSSSTAKEVDTLLRESDIICLCLALNSATRGIIDERRLSLLKKGAILINVARGAHIDEKALVKLLKNNAIRGAGLDVFENEPFTGSAPMSIVEIASLPNVVATPHMAYNTLETTERLGKELLENVDSCLKGRPVNIVNG